ncbi:MAG: hypothetical protein AAGF81_19615 [Pseudomonadota bacterium]
MTKSGHDHQPRMGRMLWFQAFLGAVLGLVFGIALLIFNVANMGTLLQNSDVKLLAGFLYFSSLMSTFALGMVSSYVLGLGTGS